VSFDIPEFTGDITGMGTTRILEAVRRSGIKTRFYQASSSEMFGAAPPPQSESTPFHPRSPYAATKVYAYWMTVNYREAHGLFAANGILFNHESSSR
jgi:GDPmannose 4,6-dehydratase